MLTEEKIEEIQEEFFNILGNMKLLHKNGKIIELEQYINEQYEILKKELDKPEKLHLVH